MTCVDARLWTTARLNAMLRFLAAQVVRMDEAEEVRNAVSRPKEPHPDFRRPFVAEEWKPHPVTAPGSAGLEWVRPLQRTQLPGRQQPGRQQPERRIL